MTLLNKLFRRKPPPGMELAYATTPELLHELAERSRHFACVYVSLNGKPDGPMVYLHGEQHQLMSLVYLMQCSLASDRRSEP